MKPDMVFLDDDNQLIGIADAKWKILDDREKKLGISQSDLYQMAGYSCRYGVDRLALIYPRQQWLQDSIDFRLQGTSSTLRVIPIDVTSSHESFDLPTAMKKRRIVSESRIRMMTAITAVFFMNIL